MSRKSNSKIGKIGEEIGVTYLKQIGYKIIETNYRCPFGEIDVITKSKGFLVFVEIKSRLQSAFGTPEESVNLDKQRRIAKTAQWYLATKRLSDVQARFDVLAISITEAGECKFLIIESAFEVE